MHGRRQHRLANLRIVDAVKQSDKHAGGIVGRQRLVEPGERDGGRIAAGAQMPAQSSHRHHKQRRRHPFAADVADDKHQPAILQLPEVVEISRYLSSR